MLMKCHHLLQKVSNDTFTYVCGVSFNDAKQGVTPEANTTTSRMVSLGVVKKMRKSSSHGHSGTASGHRDVTTTAHDHDRMQVDSVNEAPVAGSSKDKIDHETDEYHEAHGQQPQEVDDLQEIRRLLLPPPIPSTVDWGIPPASLELCDEDLEVSLPSDRELRQTISHTLITSKHRRN